MVDPEELIKQMEQSLPHRYPFRMIDRVMELLSPRQRELTQALRFGATMAEASRLLGTPRSTLYDELERIRKIFFDEGLQEYL